MKEPKQINVSENYFTANGNKYFITDKISIARYREYEKLVPEITFGMGFEELFNGLKKLYQSLESNKRNDAVVTCHNIMNGIADFKNPSRIMPALMVCALIIIGENEDAGIYDKQTQLNKIKDWEAEGLSISDFFTLAVNGIRGFNSTLSEYISSEAKKIVKKEDLLKAP